MVTVPVVWVSDHPEILARGYADQAWLEATLDGSTWRAPGLPDFVDCSGFENLPEGAERAVVVIPGRWHTDDVTSLSERLDRLSSALVVITGDEESAFDWERLEGANRRVWVQTPRSDRHQQASVLLGDGWWPGTRELLDKIDDGPRPLNWFYSGQVNNPRREECVKALTQRSRRRGDGEVVVTGGFAQGLERDEYVARLASTKVAPAPPGCYSPDSFRVFEALEAGCIPVVDTGVNGRACDGYWEFLFGERPPFPVIDHWSRFGEVCDELVAGWPANANRCGAWWMGQKRRLSHRLVGDLAALGVPTGPRLPDDNITVLVPTSPIPSHPDTAILDETVASIRERLPDSEILLMIDGVRPEQADRRSDYDEYTRRVVRKAQREWRNVLPVVFDEHQHQAEMTRRTLYLVTTPLILFVEHDTPLIGPQVEWEPLSEAVMSGEVNVVRFLHETHVLDVHRHLVVGAEATVLRGVPLIKTLQYSQRPHLAGADFYRGMLADHFGPSSRSMIEDRIHGVVECDSYDMGRTRAWRKWKLAIYAGADESGSIKRSSHTDGRAGDPKFDMDYGLDQ